MKAKEKVPQNLTGQREVCHPRKMGAIEQDPGERKAFGDLLAFLQGKWWVSTW